ncbi:chemotaxis protein CheW [uncultured Psychrosphaera sp.]|uniref:chemotaxis protein CheW n=1 Tax=uncultured Psychrosphaera sp. TaxID=1403522 RepID=UPI00262E45F9|nr:chemotaxis protein CheW [uncultured Psychrosphaera sp.]
MLDYLGQLLSEEDEADDAIGSSVNSIQQKQELDKVESNYRQTTEELAPIKTHSQLRPITSRVAKFKEYKEEPETKLAEPNSVEKLLQQVDAKQELQKNVKEESKTVDLVGTEVKVESKIEPVIEKQQDVAAQDEFPDKPFQALFFEVAGLVLAVPLKELGGIHNLTEINSLFGKPKWFKGVMLNREQKLNVVDSALWVMPEKFDTEKASSIDYKYLITLGDSNWGLTAERLVETEMVHPDSVKWRNGQGKRPWLLGTIKEKMCALLHVSDLIAMLEQGINARQE